MHKYWEAELNTQQSRFQSLYLFFHFKQGSCLTISEAGAAPVFPVAPLVNK